MNKKHAVHDNSVPLHEPKDIYILSNTFFKGFSDRYGVDVEIKQVRYNSIQDILDENYRIRGPFWSSFSIEESSYISPYSHLFDLPMQERKDEEMRYMNSHQNA